MSAEDMRIELETFVNQGLAEGWCGWPTKQRRPDRRESDPAWKASAAGIGYDAAPMDFWLPSLAVVARGCGGNGSRWSYFR